MKKRTPKQTQGRDPWVIIWSFFSVWSMYDHHSQNLGSKARKDCIWMCSNNDMEFGMLIKLQVATIGPKFSK